jgi:hypothetical protein
MAPTNYSIGRDTHIYDNKDCCIILGGLTCTNVLKNVNFYSVVRDSCLFDE